MPILQKIVGRGYSDYFLTLAVLLICVKITGKIFDAGETVEWAAFANHALVVPCVLSVLFFLFLFLLALLWARIVNIPATYLFLILPFLLFFLCMMDGLTVNIGAPVVIRTILGVLLAYPALKYGRKTGAWPRISLKFNWRALVLTLFVLQSTFLFLGQNLQEDRTPFADEGTFWYTASVAIIERGLTEASQQSYSGGGLHPFGVPFLSGLPALFWGNDSHHIPFFMPVYVILGLVLFLREAGKDDSLGNSWVFVCFVLIFFAAFNNRSWAGMLVYSMVYGESVSILLVLSLLSWLIFHNRFSNNIDWCAAAFLLGLLGLTKFPLIMHAVIFFIVFLSLAFKEKGKRIKIPFMILLFVVPWMVLQLFQMKYGGSIGGGASTNTELVWARLTEPNILMLKQVCMNIAHDAENLWYYFLFGFICSFFAARHWRVGWPLLIWLMVLYIHYGYLYYYGAAAGRGDYGSGLRYFLPAAAGVLFLGAVGYGRLMEYVTHLPAIWYKPVLFLVCMVPLFFKFF